MVDAGGHTGRAHHDQPAAQVAGLATRALSRLCGLRTPVFDSKVRRPFCRWLLRGTLRSARAGASRMAYPADPRLRRRRSADGIRARPGSGCTDICSSATDTNESTRHASGLGRPIGPRCASGPSCASGPRTHRASDPRRTVGSGVEAGSDNLRRTGGTTEAHAAYGESG